MKFLFFAAGLLSMQSLLAQRTAATVSPPEKDIFPEGKMVRAGNYLVGFDEGNIKGRFMGIGFDGTIDKLGAIIYDTNMTLLKAIPLKEAASNHGALFTDIQVVNGVPYVIYHEAKDKMGLGNIMAIPIDLEQQVAKKAMIIGDVDKAGFDFRYNLFGLKGFNYSFYQSPDGAYQLVLANADDGKCFITVLDKNMKIHWSVANIFTKDDKATVHSACVTNQGDVYLAIQRYVKKAVDARLIPVIKGKRQADILLNFERTAGYGPNVLSSKNNPDLVEVAGITITDKSHPDGIYRVNYNTANKKLSTPVYTSFADSLMYQLEVDGWAISSKSSKKFGVSKNVYPFFQMRGDGSLMGTAELEDETRSERAVYTRYGPILFFNFYGDKVGFNRIPKDRVSTVSGIGAHGNAFTMGNETVVFYNDNAKNLKKNLDERAKRSNKYNDHVLIAAIFQPDGTMHREVAVDLDSENYLAIPRQAVQLSFNRWLIPFSRIKGGGRESSSQRWAIVTIK